MFVNTNTTECVVSGAPGVQIQCVAMEDGSISIQTEIGPINIVFRRLGNRKRRQSGSIGRPTVWTLSESSVKAGRGATFWFAGIGDVDEGVGEKEAGDVDASTTGERGQFANAEEEGIDAAEDNAEEDISPEHDAGEQEDGGQEDEVEDDEGSNPEKKIKEYCQKLGVKILNGWKEAPPKTKKLEELLANPSTFFARQNYISYPQWSYQKLNDLEKNLHLYRLPFHKMDLAIFWNRYLPQGSKINAAKLAHLKAAMFQDLVPGYQGLSRKEKDKNRKQIKRYVKQGEVLLSMSTRKFGLILSVSHFITTEEFDILWKYKDVPYVFELRWLNEELLEESEDYSAPAKKFFTLMPEYFAGSKRKAEDPHDVRPQKRQSLLHEEVNDISGDSPHPQKISPQQRLVPPALESSQEHVPTRDGAAVMTQGLQIQPSSLPALPSGQNASLSDPSLELLYAIRTISLKRSIDDSTYLHLLAYSLGSFIPELLFARTTSAQLRWNDSGGEQKVSAYEAGLDPQLLEILLTEERLIKVRSSFYILSETRQCWTIPSDIQIHLPGILTEREKAKWSIKSLKWICFAFPRIRQRESQYASLIRSLLPLLEQVLQDINPNIMPRPLKYEVSEVLLAASKIEGIRRHVLLKVANFLDEGSPPYLRAELALEQSILSRLIGDFNASERAIHDFCCHCGTPTDECIPDFFHRYQPSGMQGRLNAMLGLLHRSHLENLTQCEKYHLAQQQVNDWQILNPPSQIELSILPSTSLTSCKVYRSHGDFSAALETLKMCLKVLKRHEPIHSQVLCQLVDVYSDLNSPELAAQLIVPEIEELRKTSRHSKALRRILVSSVDNDLQQERYDHANETIEELSRIFKNLKDLNISDELLHVRLLVASARINYLRSEFIQAVQNWKFVLDCVQKYASFKGEGFTYGVLHMSMSLTYLEIGKLDEATSSYQCGRRILDKAMRDYWIPTLMAWFQFVESKIRSKTGWASIYI